MKKSLRFGLGLGIAAFFMWLLLRQLSWQSIITALKATNLWFVVLAVIVFLTGYCFRVLRWRLMLLQDNQLLSFQDCAAPLFMSFAANNILPFRAGDLLRAFGFRKRLHISLSTSLASLFVERLLDMLMLLVFLGVMLIFFGSEAYLFLGASGWLLVAIALGIATVLAFPAFFEPLIKICIRPVVHFMPHWGERIQRGVQNTFLYLTQLSKSHLLTRLLAWSFLAWGCEGFVFWLTALAIPSLAHPVAAFLALPIGSLSTLIPSTPGYVGTFDFFVVESMKILGNSPVAATAFAFLIHMILWLPPIVVGAACFLIKPLTQDERLELSHQ